MNYGVETIEALDALKEGVECRSHPLLRVGGSLLGRKQASDVSGLQVSKDVPRRMEHSTFCTFTGAATNDQQWPETGATYVFEPVRERTTPQLQDDPVPREGLCTDVDSGAASLRMQP